MQREITRELVRRLLPERMAESNKGSYGSVPVSYTHLDVYKRQIQRRALGFKLL